MTQTSINCHICSSQLAPEFIKKKNWRPDRLVQWASKRGLVIKEKELKAHLAHIDLPVDNPDPMIKVKEIVKEDSQEKTSQSAAAPAGISTDEQFLNLVINQIHNGVTSGQVDLKVEHAFKAIELKQKLTESGNVENLLLELLNEIRKQELGK